MIGGDEARPAGFANLPSAQTYRGGAAHVLAGGARPCIWLTPSGTGPQRTSASPATPMVNALGTARVVCANWTGGFGPDFGAAPAESMDGVDGGSPRQAKSRKTPPAIAAHAAIVPAIHRCEVITGDSMHTRSLFPTV